MLVASAVPVISAYHNAALRIDPKAHPEAVLATARAFAAEQGRDIVVWASDHDPGELGRAARAAGLPRVPRQQSRTHAQAEPVDREYLSNPLQPFREGGDRVEDAGDRDQHHDRD